MYIIGVDLCHLLIYSPTDHVYIKIKRDETFLSETIPRLEYFYFNYYIKLFSNLKDNNAELTNVLVS